MTGDERAETPEPRRATGLAVFDEVYGGLVLAPPAGASRALRCALRQGELSAEQVRAAATHLISYAGTPLAGGILAASEAAIATEAGS